MATLTLILQAITAVLKFPEALSAFLRLIEKTPVEKQTEIIQRVNKEMEDFLVGGRPKWD
jgi:hypothetical protein